MELLILLALAAPPPERPLPVLPQVGECQAMDVRPGDLGLDCRGVLLPRSAVISYELACQDRDRLRAQWPDAAPIPWYDRPSIARLEGGLLVLGIVGLTLYALQVPHD